MNADPKPRSTKDGPFLWISKAARQRIRDGFDATSNTLSALAVYDALCEIASNSQAEKFTTTHQWIAGLAGASIATVKRHLPVLAEIGVITISAPALRGPATYTLLALAHGERTLANGELALAHGCFFVHELDLKKEKNREEPEKRGRPPRATYVPITLSPTELTEFSREKSVTADGITKALAFFNAERARWFRQDGQKVVSDFGLWLYSKTAGEILKGFACAKSVHRPTDYSRI